jgi:hypothetical protein
MLISLRRIAVANPRVWAISQGLANVAPVFEEADAARMPRLAFHGLWHRVGIIPKRGIWHKWKASEENSDICVVCGIFWRRETFLETAASKN